jgi:Zn finger protein HypA/HybF involved in hydrogenase expression
MKFHCNSCHNEFEEPETNSLDDPVCPLCNSPDISEKDE